MTTCRSDCHPRHPAPVHDAVRIDPGSSLPQHLCLGTRSDVGNPCRPGIILTARQSAPTTSRHSHLPDRGALTPIAVWRAPAFMRLSQADRPRSIRRCALPPAVIATALSDRSCAGCRRPLQRSPFPPTSQVGDDADVRNVAPDRLVGRVGVPDGGPERGSRGGETGARAVRSADESRSSSSRTGARVPRLRLGTLTASRVPRLAVVSRRPSCK